ncbi:MAG TPA: type II toxin-antitoxin system VapC family toxin [Pyrinomonadaceae bacterium]|nr:type II toxin-antitoxin system VapC family toxin [Pyrinomonadaceae bacterium]
MSFAVDTNLLLRSLEDGHVAQPVAEKGLFALRDRGEIFSIFPQNLIEFWAVATRPVTNNGLGLSIAQAEAEVISLKTLFVLLPDTPEIFSEWEKIVLQYRVAGKQAHDARLVAAMRVHDLTHLLTFNTGDFKRFSFITAVSPQTILNDDNR